MNRQIHCAQLIVVFTLSICLGDLAFCQNSTGRASRNVNAQWDRESSCFWYRYRDNRKVKYVLVDAKSGNRRDLDVNRISKAISDITEKKTDSNLLRIDSVRFLESINRVQIQHAGNWYALETEPFQLTRYEANEDEGGDTYFLPARPSVDLGGETEIEIENKLNSSVRLFWVDREGEFRSFGEIDAGQTIRQHTFYGHVWLIRSKGEPVCAFQATSDHVSFLLDESTTEKVVVNDVQAPRFEVPASVTNRSSNSPDGLWRAFVKDDNLYLEEVKTKKDYQLTDDATSNHTFTADASRARLVQMQYNRRDFPASRPLTFWSPNSKYVVAVQTSKVAEPGVHYIESKPKNDVQPELHYYPYAKPGDPIPTPTYHVFDVHRQQEVKLDLSQLKNPFQVRFLRWSDDGESFFLHFNQRGHQRIQVLRVDLNSRKVTTIVDEKSDTFIHYSDSGKNVMRWLPSERLLWASERSGWNHLYLYDGASGELINRVTQGNWNVKRIQKIDYSTGQIWFYAVGVHDNQDPYHEHFCRVNFDGQDFQVLTESDGTHEVTLSPDSQYVVDRYSRVDLRPVTELRSAVDGALICVLEESGEASSDEQMPTRFVAKGRDGETDIWGIIHFPKDFDPDKKYPVVENIYAGPHDYHVPKAYGRRYFRQRSLADQGMIVVQIDGMGTAWRSKSFHDVCFKNLRDAGFPDRIAWMKAAAEVYPQMDLERVGIYGGSAGGQNAMAALLWHHDFYDVAVADCGCHDNRMDKIWWNEQWMGWPVDDSYVKNSNMENANLLKGHLMLVVGELDRNVDPASTTQVVARLVQANKDFEFVLVPGVGHGACETPWASRKRARFLIEHLNAESAE